MKRFWLAFSIFLAVAIFLSSTKFAAAAPPAGTCPGGCTPPDTCQVVPGGNPSDPNDWSCFPPIAPPEQPLPGWTKDICYTETADGTQVATLQGFGCIFRRILQLIVPLLGLALFVLLLAGGFQYMTAGGDPKQTQKASGTITTAIIGIVVVVGVWFIFRILGAITGLDLLNFVIPG